MDNNKRNARKSDGHCRILSQQKGDFVLDFCEVCLTQNIWPASELAEMTENGRNHTQFRGWGKDGLALRLWHKIEAGWERGNLSRCHSGHNFENN